MTAVSAISAFITRWQAASGSERANYQLFLTELTEALELPRPEPASDDTRDNAYVFERRVDIAHADGSVTRGFIDLYRRGAFVLEAKQTGLELDSGGWDRAMLRAHAQAESYARALPPEEGRPPFLVVVDVGRSLELYADFSRTGATYVPYPDPAHHRVRLADLADPAIQARLKLLWLDPLQLDPTRESARVTRAIADRLARLAKSLEAAGHDPQRVAHFLMRALFSMFAEDVGLLPQQDGVGAFTGLLQSVRDKPEAFVPALTLFWQAMNQGGFDARLLAPIRRFNGGLFADPDVIPLTRAEIDELLDAARADWRQVEPAIFGTLLERALDPRERHRLGAHYTPRAYVERLVQPTLIDPLRAEWQTVQVAASHYFAQGKPDKAREEVAAFHQRLCHVRVLDPACGSGNFLYVALELMKRLEGEVLNLLADLGDTQGRLAMAGSTVDPHQFLGVEVNPRAAAIAELVLWIGYLQWHHRIHKGLEDLPDPVLRDFHNIEHRDALIAFERVDFETDETGRPRTRWDGVTTKPHPVTGEPVPDETAQVPIERYHGVRPAEWPEAEFIVGNPPFIGDKALRRALGDGYVDAVRAAYPEVPESADFVMYWWHKAAERVRAGQARRFGFITTNSVRQTFNRRVLEAHLQAPQTPLKLAFAIPDHPWVDAADGAAVRIAMTVGAADVAEGELLTVTAEREGEEDARTVELARRVGVIHADLTIGANVAGAVALRANGGISSNGVMLAGSGFIVTPEEAETLGLGRVPGLERHIRAYRNGRDLTDRPRGVRVIDLYGLAADEVRARYPAVFQWVYERVKPERDHNNRPKLKRDWWLFAEPRKNWRAMSAGLSRYIATVETAKHRSFQFLDGSILPDHMLIAIALDAPFALGVLSSRLHVAWALAAGGRLGVGNDPRYNKTRCFETFPFPDADTGLTAALRARIGELAEAIDAHRKRVLAEHEALTLTGLYNVLEKLRAAEPLAAKERAIHEKGLVSVLKTLHDELDTAVFAAYGWSELAAALVGRPGATTPLKVKAPEQSQAEEELLTRIVALNARRSAEEAQGIVRWLRPAHQNPAGATGVQAAVALEVETDTTPAATAPLAWPKTLREQIAAVRALLTAMPQPVERLAARFVKRPAKSVAAVLSALADLGLAVETEAGWRAG
ncbi:class I SAM-dependent DNA methyltransferase [Pseudothauera hydrothermalis]|uniref:class I SAM-dependent DNA methyltransferase n=1 Tax=Pseudothauera hydrothermalis TaxID=2184083 RepID=UPI0019678C47|nr:class I SAM-dependent DNA methyltransferase [Pseudothauera hydrothermalis]